MMRFVVVSAAVPFPPIGGGATRTYHLVRALAKQHAVTLVGFTYQDEEMGTAQWEQPPFPVRVVPVRWEWPALYRQLNEGHDAEADQASAMLGFGSENPWFVSFYESPAMAATLREVASGGVDFVLFEGTDMTLFQSAFSDDTPMVLDFMDVHSLMAHRALAGKTGTALEEAEYEVRRTLAYERRVGNRCMMCLACSASEAAAARNLLGLSNVRIVPNGVDMSFFTPAARTQEQHGRIVFTGSMSYKPNIEAVCYFVREILPIIHLAIPSAKVDIVGADPTDEVLSLASSRVFVTGRVSDIRPYLARAAVIVVPILSGGGTRLKVLEAAACGKAIVTTRLGVEGLDFRDGEDLLVADGPAAFADAVVSLARNDRYRQELGGRARAVACRYDWEKMGMNLLAVIAAAASGGLTRAKVR